MSGSTRARPAAGASTTAVSLGDGTTTQRNAPVAVTNGTGVANLVDITQIAAGGEHTCVRLGTGQARCWGRGGLGQLGNNLDQDRLRPVVVRAPAGTDVLRNVTQIALGSDPHLLPHQQRAAAVHR